MAREEKITEMPGLAVASAEAAESNEIEIDLFELLFRIQENIKYIIMAAIAGFFVMALYSYLIAIPKFESTSKIYVLKPNDSAVNLSDLQIGTYLTSDYQEVFKTWEVHERVIQNLTLNYTYEDLESMLAISNPSDTRILAITVTANDPDEAALIANEYAEVARDYIKEIMSTEKPNILSVALPTLVPVSPQKARNMIIGILLGAIIAIGIISVRFLLDDKIKSTDDIMKYTGMPTLSVVPLLNEENLLRMQKLNAASQKRDRR